MVFSTDSLWDEVADSLVVGRTNAVVYADFDQDTVLHEGELRLHANGWVELPSGRLLSPAAIHHVDPLPETDD